MQFVCRDNFTQPKLTGIRWPLCVFIFHRWFFEGAFFCPAFLGKNPLIRLRTVTRQSRGNGPNLVFIASTTLSSSLSVSVFVAELGLKSINQIRLATDHIARGRPDPNKWFCISVLLYHRITLQVCVRASECTCTSLCTFVGLCIYETLTQLSNANKKDC